MIIPLWHRTERARALRVGTVLAILPPRAGGPLSAFISIIRARAFRPHTLTLSLLRVIP